MTNFIIGDTVELRFKLNISGTAAKPSAVNVLLGKDPSLSFTAKPFANDEWSAFITPVRDATPVGTVPLCIDVVLAGKLHTIIKREVTVCDTAVVSCTDIAVQTTPHVEVTPEPVIDQVIEPIPEPIPEPVQTPVSVTEPVVEPAHIVEPEVVKIVKPVEDNEEKKIVDFTKNVDEAKTPIVKAPIIPKKIELDFKSLVTEVEKKSPQKTKEKQIVVKEITTYKTPFTLKRGKIITK